jgi:hypothetical protein
MRLTIIAGLIVGLSLAIESTMGAHLRASATHAANIRPAHVSAPWYIATNQSANIHNRLAS